MIREKGIWVVFSMLLSCIGFAQEQIVFPKRLSKSEVGRSFSRDCAHGHHCCSVGCSCCLELQREQMYDTFQEDLPFGVKRQVIVERYRYASATNEYQVQIRFKKVNQSWSPLYFVYGLYDFSIDNTNSANDRKKLRRMLDEIYNTQHKLLIVNRLNEFLLLDSMGNELPMEYHFKRKLTEHLFIAGICLNNQQIFTFVDSEGKQLGPLKYTQISPLVGTAYFLVKDARWKYGLADHFGKLIIPCIYQEITAFDSVRFVLKKKNTWTLVDRMGLPLTRRTFNQINCLSEGLSAAFDLKNKAHYLDSNGKIVLTLPYKFIGEFNDGMAPVSNGGKYGFIDRTGKLVIDFRFDRIKAFHRGVAPIALKINGGKEQWSLIDKNGDIIIQKTYDQIESFKNGLARAFINGKGNGFIDTAGKELFPCRYHIDGYGAKDDWFIMDGLIRKEIGNATSLELVNRQGERVLDLSDYIGAHFNTNGSIPYEFYPYIMVYISDKKKNLIDLKGQEVFSQNYESIQFLNDEIVLLQEGEIRKIVHVKSKQVLFDLTGKKTTQINEYFIEIQTDRGIEKYTLEGERIVLFNQTNSQVD